MSFACRPLLGGVAAINPIDVTNLADEETDPADATCSMTFASDGGLSGTGNGTSLGSAWANRIDAGIGDSFWIRVTKTAGSDSTSGDVLATWLPLSSNRSWTWTRTTIGATSATITIEIATDSAGVNIVASKAGVTVTALVVVV